jgi:hypothetical protein
MGNAAAVGVAGGAGGGVVGRAFGSAPSSMSKSGSTAAREAMASVGADDEAGEVSEVTEGG